MNKQVEVDLDIAIKRGDAIRIIAPELSSPLVRMVRSRARDIETHGAAVNILIAKGAPPEAKCAGIAIRRLAPTPCLNVTEQFHSGSTSWFGGDVSAKRPDQAPQRRFAGIPPQEVKQVALVFEGLWRMAA